MSGIKRQLANDHFISHDSQGPNIALVRIFLLFEDLRCHVGWRANHCGQQSVELLVVFGKTEISDFKFVVLDKNVLWFNVPE
jgi:hypothetical protein